MGDHHHRAAVRGQPRLQPGRAARVQVVGGFVQEQDVRGIGEHAGQRHPFLLPAGERAQRPHPVQPAQAEPVQRRLHPGFRGVAFPELVLRLQVSVALQFVRFRAGQPVLQPVQLGLQRAERFQCGVDRVADGELLRQAMGLGKVAHAAVADGVPSSGASKPARIRSSVDLPAPFSPTIATCSPAVMATSTPAKSWRSP